MGRRGNGEGSYRQIRPGLWQGRFSYVDPITDERKRPAKYGNTRAEAKRKIDEVRARVEGGLPGVSAPDTLDLWCQRWVAVVLPASRLRESTQITHTSSVRSRIIGSPLGAMPLKKIRASHIDAWIVGMRQEDNLKPATVRRAYNVLSKVLSAAMRDGLIAKNPITGVDRPTAGRAKPAVLLPNELQSLLYIAQDHWMFPLLQLIAATGMRRGEALGLMWSAVDLDAGTIEIRTSLGQTSQGMKITDLKTESSLRGVAVPKEVTDVLRALRQAQMSARSAAADWQDYDVVFSRANGRPLSPDTASRHLTALCRKAGISRPIGFHAIRHEAATMMIDAGVNPKVVAEWFGHSSLRTTMETYNHANAATRALAAAAISSNVVNGAARFVERRREGQDTDATASTPTERENHA